MKNKLIALAVSSFIALSASVHAGDSAAKPVRGTVSAVADSAITVATKKNGDKTFKTDANTRFTKVDGTVIALSDIKVGAMVMIEPGATADLASKVMAIEPQKK